MLGTVIMVMVATLIGKPVGIFVASLLALALGFCRLPGDLRWQHILGAGLLGGIGFTMSIFITNLAFADSTNLVNASKMAILLASLMAGGLGFFWLRFCSPERTPSN